jgi:nucleotide-binding universal stress UspA family protein
MYKLILLPLALDQGHGQRSMDIARRLRAEDGKIIALHVIDQVPGFANYYLSSEKEEEIHESALKAIEERIGAEKDAEAVVLSGHPGRTITDYAEKIGADCIIAGSHKPEMKDFLLGSTAARIVRHAPCSVHVLR